MAAIQKTQNECKISQMQKQKSSLSFLTETQLFHIGLFPDVCFY